VVLSTFLKPIPPLHCYVCYCSGKENIKNHVDSVEHNNSFTQYHLCVPLFNFSVSCSSEMQSSMIYLETSGSAQHYVAFSTPDFRSFFFVFDGTHTRHRILLSAYAGVWFLWCWFRCLHSLAYSMLLLGHAVDWTVEWKIDISMNLNFKSRRNPYSRMKDIFLWSHIAVTRATNVCIHSFLLLLIAHELSTQISQHYRQNWTRYKTAT
jgi:hypothetical protein